MRGYLLVSYRSIYSLKLALTKIHWFDLFVLGKTSSLKYLDRGTGQYPNFILELRITLSPLPQHKQI
jgi:hypothetical protein